MKTLFHHVIGVDETNGVYMPGRFTPEQLAYLETLGEVVYHSASSCAGITMEFQTSAQIVSFSYTASMYRRSFLYFDIYENDIFCEQIRIDGKPDRGSVCYRRRLEEDSHIKICLPYSCKVSIYDLQAGDWKPLPGRPIDYLALGDSITLGSDSGSASYTFPSLLSHVLGFNFLNQGIGTYYHDPGFIGRLPDISPRLITLGYGAGDLHHFDLDTSVSHVQSVHSLVRKRFPNATIIAVTPIWRTAEEEKNEFSSQLNALRTMITQSAREYGFQVIDGFQLTPHMPAYFYDTTLHPDERGFLYYALDFMRQLNVRLPFDIWERSNGKSGLYLYPRLVARAHGRRIYTGIFSRSVVPYRVRPHDACPSAPHV